MTAAMIPTETLNVVSRAIRKFRKRRGPACARTRRCARTARPCTGDALFGGRAFPRLRARHRTVEFVLGWRSSHKLARAPRINPGGSRGPNLRLARGRRRSIKPWRRSASERSRSGLDGARVIVLGAFGPRARVQRVADMGDGHVDEIHERSVRASFPEGAGLSQFFGDLDQTIDLRHHPALLSISADGAESTFR